MLIRDVILSEGYADDLVHVIQDIMTMLMSDEVEEISTEDFKALLGQHGFVASTDEIIQAVDQSGFASSVDANSIVPASEMPGDFGQDGEEEEEPIDVGQMAGDQAMKDINKELPQ